MNWRLFFSSFILIIFFAPTIQSQDIKLKKTHINKAVVVELPADFIPMTEEDIHAKYVSYRDPIALYNSPDRNVDFGVNLSVTHWQPEDIELLQEFFENSIRALYSDVNFIKKDIETINDITYAVFEFVSTVKGEENAINKTNPISKYTLIHYAIINNKTILFNFTCPASTQKKWQNTAQQIMNSIKIKKTL